uniref:Uncharacterized protein n=1 Tax=Solanum tuberosum TaxID=4113 RepID=M1DBU6_SOLTU
MKKTSMIKRRWNPEEDELLQKLVKAHGDENWSLIGQLVETKDKLKLQKGFKICDQTSVTDVWHPSVLGFLN